MKLFSGLFNRTSEAKEEKISDRLVGQIEYAFEEGNTLEKFEILMQQAVLCGTANHVDTAVREYLLNQGTILTDVESDMVSASILKEKGFFMLYAMKERTASVKAEMVLQKYGTKELLEIINKNLDEWDFQFTEIVDLLKEEGRRGKFSNILADIAMKAAYGATDATVFATKFAELRFEEDKIANLNEWRTKLVPIQDKLGRLEVLHMSTSNEQDKADVLALLKAYRKESAEIVGQMQKIQASKFVELDATASTSVFASVEDELKSLKAEFAKNEEAKKKKEEEEAKKKKETEKPTKPVTETNPEAEAEDLVKELGDVVNG